MVCEWKDCFWGVAYEEERVKKLVETFDPAVEDYTNYDMDEAATNTTILDIDINIICWRRKVDQVKEVFTTPEDWRQSAEKGWLFSFH